MSTPSEDPTLHTVHASSDESRSRSSLYSGSSSMTPKSTSSSLRSSSTLTSGEEDAFQKPSLPTKHRTQAQTSSSSGSYPSDGKIITSIQLLNKQGTDDDTSQEVIASQELFLSQKDRLSPEFVVPKSTSTPSVPDGKKEFSIQFSGESVNSQPSYLYAHSKPELVSSPTAVGKFILTSSSSDEEKRKMLANNQEKEEEPPSLNIPEWVQKELHQSESQSIHGEGTASWEEMQQSSGQFDRHETVLDNLSDNDSILNEKNLSSDSINKPERIRNNSQQIEVAEVDIFNPQESEAVSAYATEKEHFVDNQVVSQQDWNLELSQDFSQVKRNRLAKSIIPLSKETEWSASLKRKYAEQPNMMQYDSENTKRQKIKQQIQKILNEPGVTKSCLLEVIEETTNDMCTVNSADDPYKKDSKDEVKGVTVKCTVGDQLTDAVYECTKKKKKCEAEEITTNLPQLKEAVKVFALWEGCYYSGTLKKISSNSSVTVLFDDGKSATMPQKEIFANEIFPHGQAVRVKSDDSFYDEATVVCSSRRTEHIYYTVQLDNGEYRLVDRSYLCFTAQQRKVLHGAPATSFKAMCPKSRRRRTEPALQLSSQSESSEQLFHGITFLITSESKTIVEHNSPGLYDSEDEADTAYLDVDGLRRTLTEHGGVCMDKIHVRDINKCKKFICITNRVCRTYKFLYCVVVGIPILDVAWVKDSIAAKYLKPYSRYDVPAGRNLDTNIINQNYNAPGEPRRQPYTPLILLRVFVHQLHKQRAYSRDLDLILDRLGCERVASPHCITKSTKSLPFQMNSVDCILTLTDKVPDIILNEAQAANKPVVTVEWLFQCIINNALMVVSESPVFLYKPMCTKK